jgi:hypothetical protein
LYEWVEREMSRADRLEARLDTMEQSVPNPQRTAKENRGMIVN